MYSRSKGEKGLLQRRRGHLRRMLRGKSVALFGGRAATAAADYLTALGFVGDVWIVRPGGGNTGQYPIFSSVADLPGVPDVSVLAVRPESTIDIVGALSRIGAPGAICYAAGFAELGADGRALERQLAAAAGEMALIGPNCIGFVNFFDRVAGTVASHGLAKLSKGVAIVAQSGTIGHNVAMSDRSLPIGYVVGVGNQAVLDVADIVDVILDDRRVAAVGVYVESISQPAAFSQAALKAAQMGVPIVAFKGGRSEAGREAALSHTASLSGADSVYDAFFERYGVVRARSVEQFIETLKLFAVSGPPAGDHLAILTCSGMEAILAADLAEANHIPLAAPSPDLRQALRGILPPQATVANPLDYTVAIWGNEERQRACFAAVMGGEYDGVAMITNYPAADYGSPMEWDAATNALIATAGESPTSAYFIGSLPEGVPPSVRRRLIDAGIAPLQGLDDAMAAIGLSIQWSQLRDRMAAIGRPPPIGERPNEGGGRKTLDEWSGKRILTENGIPIPRGMLVELSQAAKAADQIGYPVVLKAVAADIRHKTDLGLVCLNLRSPEEVASAANRLQELRGASSGAVLVEEMIVDTVCEVIVGVTRDPNFGNVLLIGSGGVLSELVRDTVTLILPVNEAEILQALARLRVLVLLNGYRGQPAGDVDALARAILGIAELAGKMSHSLMELDINPILVRPKGRGVMAADALFVLREFCCDSDQVA